MDGGITAQCTCKQSIIHSYKGTGGLYYLKLRLQGTLTDIANVYSCNVYGGRLIQLLSDHTT